MSKGEVERFQRLKLREEERKRRGLGDPKSAFEDKDNFSKNFNLANDLP